VVEGSDELQRGRDAYARGAWAGAQLHLAGADRIVPLAAADLELLATAAYMRGRQQEHLSFLERAYRAHLDDGTTRQAARCAFWSGMHLFLRGEEGPAGGWLARARRLLDREEDDCAERGYLLLPAMFEQAAAGDPEAAIALGAEARATGERFADPDLAALAAQDQGTLLIKQGRTAEGLGLLDEAMVAVTAGDLSPIVSGFVYCGVILGCRAAYELRRAQEWTAALSAWCDRQPDLVAFTGVCRVHRAQIMQTHGAWAESLAEAAEAARRAEGKDRRAVAEAAYVRADVHRLRGQFPAAEEAYREASRLGQEPQPGLALLRLAQGNGAAAAASIRRLLAERAPSSRRAELLLAAVEVMLAGGDPQAEDDAARELQAIAERTGGGLLGAMAAQARGAVELAGGRAGAALGALREAWGAWQEIEAPYEAARARELMGSACAALGDEDSAVLERDAAREVFERLGAAPDLARLESSAPAGGSHGLTARELEVLRLVAVGSSNRDIAERLVISEHTVARHLQNIFAKLGVSSRTAAGAFAHVHDLV
jgi:ATP/maltotriose-dependent transcriptional regulator MalT